MVKVEGLRLEIPGLNPGPAVIFFSFFAHAKLFSYFFAQIRRIRQRMRQICANLQNLIRGANSTQLVLT